MQALSPRWLSAALALLLGAELLIPASGRADGPPYTEPVRVRLHWFSKSSNASIRKLGIHAAINGGVPRAFELDTGGSGFFATYGNHSPWWGSSVNCLQVTCTSFTTTYDSGLTYSGEVVPATVQLFDSAASGSLRLSTETLSVGRTDQISCNGTGTCASSNDPSGWNVPGQSYDPPVEGNFFGDFGLSVKQSSQGNDSPVLQPAFWSQFDANRVRQGFRVHASQNDPWIQFGLRPEELAVQLTTFALNTATGGTMSDTGGINNASLLVQGSPSAFQVASSTTVLFDTGATTTIHSGAVTLTGNQFPGGVFPCALTNEGCPASSSGSYSVLTGAQMVVRGLSLMPGAGEVDILNLTAGSDKDTDLSYNQIDVQGYGNVLAPACEALLAACYYLNAGILPFLSNDIIINLDPALATPRLTLAPMTTATPSPLPLLGLVAMGHHARRLRQRLRLRDQP